MPDAPDGGARGGAAERGGDQLRGLRQLQHGGAVPGDGGEGGGVLLRGVPGGEGSQGGVFRGGGSGGGGQHSHAPDAAEAQGVDQVRLCQAGQGRPFVLPLRLHPRTSSSILVLSNLFW